MADPGNAPLIPAQIVARLSELESENAWLRQRSHDQEFVEALRSAFSIAAITGTIGAQVGHSQLLQMIVETARQVLHGRAASLSLLDEGTDELVFEVASGAGAAAIKQFRVPVGYGIAGLVAQAGTPIWTNDAQADPRHAADIARGSGLLPDSLICVPLFVSGRLIGVMEVVDTESGADFDERDVEVLEVFARQAAVAIEQSRVQQNVAALVGEIVSWLSAQLDQEHRRSLQSASGPFTAGLEGDVTFRRALDLARVVQEIASRGADEAADCLRLLREYVRATAEPRLADAAGGRAAAAGAG